MKRLLLGAMLLGILGGCATRPWTQQDSALLGIMLLGTTGAAMQNATPQYEVYYPQPIYYPQPLYSNPLEGHEREGLDMYEMQFRKDLLDAIRGSRRQP